MKTIFQVIDEALQRMKKEHFPMTAVAEEVPTSMVDLSIEAEEDYIGWNAIPSTIDDEEISEFEQELNCTLPTSYKQFLQYKFFMELHLEDTAIKLHNILPDTRMEHFKIMNINMAPRDEIIDKGYFYFADFHDYGSLLFDMNQPKEDNEFEVLLVMQDDLDDKHVYAKSFTELLNFDKNQSNRFIEKYNKKG